MKKKGGGPKGRPSFMFIRPVMGQNMVFEQKPMLKI